MRRKTQLLAAVLLCGTLTGCVPLTDSALHEQLIPWDSYEITGPNEITITVFGGDPLCETIRTVSTERDGVLSVAIIRGYPADSPQTCRLFAREEKLVFSTVAPADTVILHQMSAAAAGL